MSRQCWPISDASPIGTGETPATGKTILARFERITHRDGPHASNRQHRGVDINTVAFEIRKWCVHHLSRSRAKCDIACRLQSATVLQARSTTDVSRKSDGNRLLNPATRGSSSQRLAFAPASAPHLPPGWRIDRPRPCAAGHRGLHIRSQVSRSSDRCRRPLCYRFHCSIGSGSKW
jgi:hypothetical protein